MREESQKIYVGAAANAGQGGGATLKKSILPNTYSLESSRDLQNALLCTTLRSHFLSTKYQQIVLFCQHEAHFYKISAKFSIFWKMFDKKLKFESSIKESIV